jgi:nucleotide-binding universal stress UspA family protein
MRKITVSRQKNDLIIRRILVALDASPHSQAALDAAANIAELLNAELVGMFVEDINLLRVAQLPFVREVSFPAAEMHDIDEAVMERHWQRLAGEAQRQLIELAGKSNVNWSFGIERGGVTDRLLAASKDMDLLAIGRLGRSLSRQMRLGSTARNVLRRSKRSVMLMRSPVDLSQPVIMIYDGSQTAQQALGVASTLAKQSASLRVLVWTDDHEHAQQVKNQIVDLLGDQELEISFRRFYPSEMNRLIDFLQKTSLGLLVVGVSDSQFAESAMQSLLELVERPILIVR